MDRLTPEQRSRNMARIKGKDTSPELSVRRMLHTLGYRYRLHRKDLPGTPDIVFPERRKAVLVHGCFWHRHNGCRFAYVPKTRTEFWKRKFDQNVTRDQKARRDLRKLGWKVLVVWECELRKLDRLQKRLVAFVEGARVRRS